MAQPFRRFVEHVDDLLNRVDRRTPSRGHTTERLERPDDRLVGLEDWVSLMRKQASAVTVDDPAARVGEFVIDTASEGVPASPRNLIGRAGDMEAVLVWDAPERSGVITAYQLRIGDSEWVTLSTFPAGNTYTVTTLDNGTRYVFGLRAVNSFGAGAAATVSVTPRGGIMTPGAPDAPSVVSFHNRAVATWSEPSNTGGAPVTSYNVRYRKLPGSWVRRNGLTGTSAVIEGLEPDIEYQVQVQAVNYQGAGDWSLSRDFETRRAVVPDTPDAPLVAAVNTTTILARWNAPDNDGPPITHYRVRHRPTGHSYWAESDLRDISLTINEFLVTGLIESVDYEIQVAAVNEIGPSDYSEGGIGGPDVAPTTVPGVITNLTVFPSSTRIQLDIRWGPPVIGGSSVTHYNLRYRILDGDDDPANDPMWTELQDDAGDPLQILATTYLLDMLNEDTNYEVQVRAVNMIGPGEWSESTEAMTVDLPGTVPGRPDAPTVTRLMDDEGNLLVTVLKMSWTPPTSDGGQPIIAYDIEYDNGARTPVTLIRWVPDEDVDVAVGISSTAVLEDNITNLMDDTGYRFRVAARNQLGAGPFSASTDASTGDALPPPQMAAPTVRVVEGTNLHVTWRTLTLPEGAVPLREYEVSYNRVIDPAAPRAPANYDESVSVWVFGAGGQLQDLETNIIGVAPMTTYAVRVRARNTAGLVGAYSDRVEATTGAGSGPRPPGRPDTPTVAADASNPQTHAILDWQPPDDHGSSPIVQYVIAWNRINIEGEGDSEFILVPDDAVAPPASPPTRFTIGGLRADEGYKFRVAAINAVDRGAYSSNVTFTTSDATPPTPPTNVEVSSDPNENDTLYVTWDPPTSNGGVPIIDYDVRRQRVIDADNDVYGRSFYIRDIPVASSDEDASESYELDIGGLYTGTSYRIAVRCTNAVGYSSNYTMPVTQATSGLPDPDAPGLLTPARPDPVTLEAFGRDGFRASWTAPTAPDNNPIQGYTLAYNTTTIADGGAGDRNGPSQFIEIGRTTDLVEDVVGLEQDTIYDVRVRAINESDPDDLPADTLPGGNGQYSANANITIGSAIAPSRMAAPRIFSAGDELAVYWRPPLSDGGADISQYLVRWRVTEDAGGSGGDPPGPVTELMATAESTSSIRVTWTAPTDMGTGTLTYNVSWGDGSRQGISGTNHLIEGLSAATAYTIRVSAQAGSAVGPTRTTSATTTSTAAPSVPTSFFARAGTNRINFSWEAPASPGSSPIASYLIRRTGGAQRDASFTITRPSGGWPREITYTDTTAVNGNTYRCFISATNDDSLTGPEASATAAL